MIFYLLIGTLSVIGNFIVLFVIYKSKQLRHSQYVYNFSIAVSDIFWGFSISVFFLTFFIKLLNFDPINLKQINDALNRVETIKEVNNITTFKYQLDHVRLYTDFSGYSEYFFVCLLYITPITLFVSFISLLFASIDRYVALTFPFRYKQLNSINIAKIVSVLNWLLSAIVNTVSMFSSIETPQMSFLFQSLKNVGPEKKIDFSNRDITAAILFILFGLLWIFTFMTLYSLYKSHKRSSSLNKSTRKGVSLEKQMSLIMIIMVFAFTFSLFPTIYLNARLYLNKDGPTNISSYKQFFVSVAFLTTNSVWNFVIYNILNKKFRSAFVKICFKCK